MSVVNEVIFTTSSSVAPAASRQSLDVLADLLDLLRHVALADDVAALVAGHLARDEDLPLAAGDRQHVPVELLAAEHPGHQPSGW